MQNRMGNSMNQFKRGAIFGALALGTVALGSCVTNPATGEVQLILLSERQEIELGREGAQSVEASIGVYDDQELEAYIEGIGQALAESSERPDLPWSFKVMDDGVVNAFALPGGFIYVTRGILGHFSSEAELAGVLGHEIGHVTARHSAERLSKQQLTQIGLGVGSVFSPTVARFGGIINTGLAIAFLKFSRDDERQADELGYRYMRRDDYDPTALVAVFTMLGRVTEAASGRGVPGWLATHPDPGERVERAERRIAEDPVPAGGVLGRDRYLEKIDGLVFGENPRQGFFRGNLFLHPDLEFRFTFPVGWQTVNTARAVGGISPNEDAIIQLTLAQGSFAEAAAREFFSQEGVRSQRIKRQAINGHPATWGYFSLTSQDGTLSGVTAFVEFDGIVYQLLGYTSQAISAYDEIFRTSVGSFDRLTDPAALEVQPKKIALVKLDRAQTLEEFDRRYPSTISLEALAIINGVAERGTIPVGTTMKRVVGGPEENN